MTICEKCRLKVAENKVIHPRLKYYLWICEECEKEMKQWKIKIVPI